MFGLSAAVELPAVVRITKHLLVLDESDWNSSLTWTKAYVAQYAPDGAGDWKADYQGEATLHLAQFTVGGRYNQWSRYGWTDEDPVGTWESETSWGHDSQGKIVPKTRLGKRFGREPKATVALENISLKGSSRWKILIIPEEWDVQIRHLNLVEHFKDFSPGEYVMTVEVRVYQKDDKGNLKLVKPPLWSGKVLIN